MEGFKQFISFRTHTKLFPFRLWLLPYRRPSSSIQTCRWLRQLLSGKQNHPLRTDTVHQRYSWHLDAMQQWMRFLHPLNSFEVKGFNIHVSFLCCSPDFLRRECPPLDKKRQCPTWNCRPPSQSIKDYCLRRSARASYTSSHTNLKQDSSNDLICIWTFHYRNRHHVQQSDFFLQSGFTSKRKRKKKTFINFTWLITCHKNSKHVEKFQT